MSSPSTLAVARRLEGQGGTIYDRSDTVVCVASTSISITARTRGRTSIGTAMRSAPTPLSRRWTIFREHTRVISRKRRRYAKRHGHSRVPDSYCAGELQLGTWVSKQRSKHERLSPERKRRLEKLPGWVWRVS